MPLEHKAIQDLESYDPLVHNLFGFDTLHQDQRWKDVEGRVHFLVEMDNSYRKNVLMWLLRRAAFFELKDALLTLRYAPTGEQAQLDYDCWLEWRHEHPREWLEQTALVKRLRELIAEGEEDPDWTKF